MTTTTAYQKQVLGTIKGGKALIYNERLYEFMVDQEVIDFAKVKELDDQGSIAWFYLEQRDWFKKLDGEMMSGAHAKALLDADADLYEGMTPEERVRADAARDDSILAGKIIEADPALVHAVVQAIEEEGLLSVSSGASASGNPLAHADLPKGMEALSQMERARGGERKMTHTEKRLMKRILKNDDKEKRRREKHAEKLGKKDSSASGPDTGSQKSDSPTTPDAADSLDVVEIESTVASAATGSTGRFSAFMEKTLSQVDGNNLGPDEGGVSFASVDDQGSRRVVNEYKVSGGASCQDIKAEMETVPGMKEAQGSNGVLNVVSSVLGLLNRGGGGGRG